MSLKAICTVPRVSSPFTGETPARTNRMDPSDPSALAISRPLEMIVDSHLKGHLTQRDIVKMKIPLKRALVAIADQEEGTAPSDYRFCAAAHAVREIEKFRGTIEAMPSIEIPAQTIVPEDLRDVFFQVIHRIADPNLLADWLSALSSDVIEVMLTSRQPVMRAQVKRSRPERVYFHHYALLFAAWGRLRHFGFKRLGKVQASLENDRFSQMLRDRIGIVDMASGLGEQHGRDAHAVQIAYAFEGISPRQVAAAFQFMGSSPEGLRVWAMLFDTRRKNLTSPDSWTRILKPIFGNR